MYVTQLSRALSELGHRITVLAGPPYPDLPEDVVLERVPSLDLYRAEDPFRRPHLREFRDLVDVYEFAAMCTAAFPEPLSFSLRAARLLRSRPEEFDLVHDNQSLGYGLLDIDRSVPTLATIHHPISIDRRMALAGARTLGRNLSQRRWYAFVRMQKRVARRLRRIISVSDAAARDVVTDFGVSPARLGVVRNGVDASLFRPIEGVERVPGRIITVASSDLPSKGLEVLVEAVAKLSTERDVELVVVGRGGEGRELARSVARFAASDVVRTLGRVEVLEMIRGYAQAEVAVVPSLYEGFSLPAIEALSCGVPLVASDGGALREVVGDAGELVPPGDAGAMARAIAHILDHPAEARRRGVQGRERVLDRFTWFSAAEALVSEYRKVLSRC